MKVLALFPELQADNPGGIQATGLLARRALQAAGQAHCLEIPARKRFAAMRTARRIEFHPDLMLFWHLDLLRLAPLTRNNARRVVFLHGIESWRRRGPLTRSLLRNSAVIANTSYTLERARVWLPMIDAGRARIVHLGWREPTPSPGAPIDPPCAIMIGRLDVGERYKGHDEVIRAWPRVRERVSNAQLWIVGEGDLRAELETLAVQLQLDDAVRFFGRVGESEKEKLIGAARCLVLPSKAEGFGLVYLEAMRLGRPCLVGTDAGREVVEPPSAGIAVQPGNANELVDALVQLLTCDGDWQHKSITARARYAAHFTAAHFEQRLLNALQSLR